MVLERSIRHPLVLEEKQKDRWPSPKRHFFLNLILEIQSEAVLDSLLIQFNEKFLLPIFLKITKCSNTTSDQTGGLTKQPPMTGLMSEDSPARLVTPLSPSGVSVSCIPPGPGSEIPPYWLYNTPVLLWYWSAVHMWELWYPMKCIWCVLKSWVPPSWSFHLCGRKCINSSDKNKLGSIQKFILLMSFFKKWQVYLLTYFLHKSDLRRNTFRMTRKSCYTNSN